MCAGDWSSDPLPAAKLTRNGGQDLLLQGSARPSAHGHEVGVLRTTLVNYTAATLYALGVSPVRIRRFYDRRLSSG